MLWNTCVHARLKDRKAADLQHHHEEAEYELANAVTESPQRTQQRGLKIAAANCQGRQGLQKHHEAEVDPLDCENRTPHKNTL
jgi:hypothetical protein